MAFALAQPQSGRRLTAFRVVGYAILITWPLGATLGVLVSYIAPDPRLLGLDSAFPAIFLAILIGTLNRRNAGPAATGATIAAAATPFVAAGIAPILGLVGLLATVRKRERRV